MRWRRGARRVVARWSRLSRRYGWLDHIVRAGVRYQRADGRRLAAAVAFYGFFAAFGLGLLGFAVLGYVLDEPAVDRTVQRFLDEHLPAMDTQALRDARSVIGLFALVSLPVMGMLWVDSLRSSVRALWQIEEYPGRFLGRWTLDFLAMVALGLVLLVSLTVAFGAEALLDRLVMAAGGDGLTATRWFMALVGFVFGFAVNTLFAVAVLTLLPRLRVPWRRVLVPAVVIAIGVEGLTSMGRLVVARAEANPAFQVVAGAAGLLVFLLILNQLILFAAALTATGTGGRVVDLATGQRLDADAPARPRPTVSQRPDPDRDVTPQQPTTPSP